MLVGSIGVFYPNVFGVGYETITDALNSALPATLLVTLLLAKIATTSITIGSGGSGGIFAPSLFMGATTGGFMGTIVHEWFPASTASSGAYALVTMGAVVAAATHAPITAIIMIFELTQTINIIPPLMAACVVSTLVSTFLSRDSIYTMKLRRRGIDLFEEESLNILKTLRAHDIVDREPEVLLASDNFQTVVAWDNPKKLIGCIHKKDVLHAYNREVMRRDMAGSMSSTVLVASKGQQVELAGGYVLQEIQPPPRYFGRTLRELDIGAETGVQVVLLRKRSTPDRGPEVRVPNADDRIDEGDRLVVAGTRSAVESIDVL